MLEVALSNHCFAENHVLRFSQSFAQTNRDVLLQRTMMARYKFSKSDAGVCLKCEMVTTKVN